MLKKTIKYTDFDGNEREEDFYFNLTEAELFEMELSSEGGMENYVRQLINEQDGAKIIAIFKSLILKSVGKKSPDGRRFMKSEAISQEFSETGAYTKLFMQLATDAQAASDFMNAIIPTQEQMNMTANNQSGDKVVPIAASPVEAG